MAVLAVLIPLLMLGVVLALGRYEELLLQEEEPHRHDPVALPTVAPPAIASRGPAGTPAPSP